MARRIQEVLLIETRHRPGTLAGALQVLAQHGINLEHLHALSRERGWTRWELTVEVTPAKLEDALQALADWRTRAT